MSIYGFRGSPSYRTADPEEQFTQAMDMPMSLGSTFWDQTQGGIMESFGLGTAIRDATAPMGNTSQLSALEQMKRAAGQLMNPVGAIVGNVRRLTGEATPSMSEEEYKASPYFRDAIPWDAAMTQDRAAALAGMYDIRVTREHFAQKRPITSFFGNLTGQAIDPINYIPIAGPIVKAAAVSRAGVIGGNVLTSSLDAAANTALAGALTAETRSRFGDEITWQRTVSEIAMAALIGAAFGTVGGALERRAGIRADVLRQEAEQRLGTLKATQEARIALNEAIGGLVNDGEVRLGPNAVDPIQRIAAEIDRPAGMADASPGQTIDNSAGKAVALLDDNRAQGSASLDAVRRDLDQIIDAEILKAQRTKFKDALVSMRAKLDAVSDGIPVELRESLETAIERNDPEGWAGFRAALDVSEASDALPANIMGLLTDFDLAFNTPAARSSDFGMREFLTKEYANAVEYYRTLSPFRLRETQENILSGDPNWQIDPVPLKALNDVIAEKTGGGGSPSLDTSAPRPEQPPAGRAEAEAAVAKPETYKTIADQYRVDPETGSFAEEPELARLVQEGKVTQEDAAILDAADETYKDSAAYGEALKSVVGCLL